jgi:hypothetical protein
VSMHSLSDVQIGATPNMNFITGRDCCLARGCLPYLPAAVLCDSQTAQALAEAPRTPAQQGTLCATSVRKKSVKLRLGCWLRVDHHGMCGRKVKFIKRDQERQASCLRTMICYCPRRSRRDRARIKENLNVEIEPGFQAKTWGP